MDEEKRMDDGALTISVLGISSADVSGEGKTASTPMGLVPEAGGVRKRTIFLTWEFIRGAPGAFGGTALR